MTEVLAFMAGNGCLTLSLAGVALPLVGLVLLFVEGSARSAFLILNRILRTINILARGWPPEHLDADGDHVKMVEASEDGKGQAGAFAGIEGLEAS